MVRGDKSKEKKLVEKRNLIKEKILKNDKFLKIKRKVKKMIIEEMVEKYSNNKMYAYYIFENGVTHQILDKELDLMILKLFEGRGVRVSAVVVKDENAVIPIKHLRNKLAPKKDMLNIDVYEYKENISNTSDNEEKTDKYDRDSFIRLQSNRKVKEIRRRRKELEA